MANTNRDKVRGSLMGQAKCRTEIVRTEDGTEIEVRELTVSQRNRIAKACTKRDGDGMDYDVGKDGLLTVIESAHLPGTGERLFDESDIEALESMPGSSGWYAKVRDASRRLNGLENTEARAKNSDATPSA